MDKAGTPEFLKEMNQKLIIETLRSEEVSSRADLSKILKISAPSISRNVSHLLKKKILREIGEGDSIGGRKPTLLQLNDTYKIVAGVDFSGMYTKLALGNLKGKIIASKNLYRGDENISDNVLSETIGCLHALLRKRKFQTEELGAITIGIPGVVNSMTGEMMMSAITLNNKKNIDIRGIFEKEFKTAVMIHNDTNLAALGESHYGEGKKHRNLVVINIDRGVGGGIIIENKIYSGDRFAAGELGYLLPCFDDLNQTDFTSDQRLENRVSITMIMNDIKKELRAGIHSMMLSFVNNDIDKVSYESFIAAVHAGDPYSISKVLQITRFISWAIINIQSLLDIDTLIIGGEIVKLGNILEKSIRESLKKYVPKQYKINVDLSKLGDKAGVYGSFVISLEYVYKHLLEE